MNIDLLAPRYEVIAGYPDSPFSNGEILELRFRENNGKVFGWEDTSRSPGIWDEDYLLKYPHLFRKLQWWEHRKPEEMPEYVKCVQPMWRKEFNCVAQIEKLEYPFVELKMNGANCRLHIENFYPATLTDYTTYINQSKK